MTLVSCDREAQERAADVGELRRGVVGHLARGQERPADRRGHVARVLHLGGEARQAGGAVHPGHPAGDLDAALDERGEIRERPGLEVGSPHPGPREGLGRVGEVVVGLAADDPEERHPLARPGQGLPDGRRLGEGLEGLQASPSLD